MIPPCDERAADGESAAASVSPNGLQRATTNANGSFRIRMQSMGDGALNLRNQSSAYVSILKDARKR